jgi:phospholipid/cholesterol/gamma-HCH transport system substrate-binding protein
VEFRDVTGLPDKSVVKLSGVAVGKIDDISLSGDRVRVRLAVKDGVKIYRDAKIQVGATSMIGSKFLQVDQGRASAGELAPGDVVMGSDDLPLDRAMSQAVEDIQGFVKELRGNGSMTKNLNDILANLKEVTGGLKDIVSATQPHAGNIAERLDAVTGKLDGIMTKADALLVKISAGDGVAGALINDNQMKENVTSTLNNLKDASASVKEMVGRVGGFKTYWDIQMRYEPLAHGTKSDMGIKIYPREGHYYYLGGANLMSLQDRARGVNYETPNTIDARIGWDIKAFELYAGALRGTGGVGVKYRPFFYDPKWSRLKFLLEASEFSRRRTIKERFFDKPRYDAGMEFTVSQHVSAGMRVNDLQEVRRVNYTARVMFEDKDIAYLLGLASIGSAGVRSK